MRADGTVRLDSIAEHPLVHLNGGKVLIYAITALDDKKRFAILFERTKDGGYLEWIRATQGHTIDLQIDMMYDHHGPVLDHVKVCTHGSLLYNLPSIIKFGLKLGTSDGGRLCLHAIEGTPDSMVFADRNKDKKRDFAFTMDLDKMREQGFAVVQAVSGNILIGTGTSDLKTVPISCVTGFWRVFHGYEPLLCCADTVDYYLEFAKVLFTKRENLKGKFTRYPLPIMDDTEQPWFGKDLVQVQRPARGAGSTWFALPDVVDPEIADDASQWANAPPGSGGADMPSCRYDARGCDRVGRDKRWEEAGWYVNQRPSTHKRWNRAHDNFPNPPGRDECCSVCGGDHFRQWCPQYCKNRDLQRFFMAPTPQLNPWPGPMFRGGLNQELLNQSMVMPDSIFPKSDQRAAPRELAHRKVSLRDHWEREPGRPAAYVMPPWRATQNDRADTTCIWPMIQKLRQKAESEAKKSYDKGLAELTQQLADGALPSTSSGSGHWTPNLSWHSNPHGDPQNRDLNGSDGFGRPARGPPMSAEQRRELREQIDAKERNQKLWPLSYYIAEVPPVDARAEISASVLIVLQKRFPDDISDAEIGENVDAAHHQFVAARLAKQTIVEGGQPGVQPINPEGARNRTLQAHLHPRERSDLQVENRNNRPEAEPLPPGVMALN
ncbi:MAG: RNA 2'-phosphotransferase, partial [Candidatus Latescibacterota bacterium]|nr:RNA 2'-phosphotransferase [Candidatus Latescibacterota bacterium]